MKGHLKKVFRLYKNEKTHRVFNKISQTNK